MNLSSLKPASNCTRVRYLAVTVISISSHKVDTVAVFIPECSLVWEGTVGDSDVIVMVISGKRTTIVIGHRITYKETEQTKSQLHGMWHSLEHYVVDLELEDKSTSSLKMMFFSHRICFFTYRHLVSLFVFFSWQDMITLLFIVETKVAMSATPIEDGGY